MPANKKYLTQSVTHRILKITAALLGGYLVTTSFHLLLMQFLDKKDVYMTMHFSVYLMWAGLMIIAFLSRNGWKIWGWYLFAAFIFFTPFLVDLFGK